MRRLRKFARQGADDELALDATIQATASNAGYLDIRMQPERKNRIKVLMLMDVGGTMDDHIERTEELFSAAKTEFKNMEFFYFHNCVYDYLWKNNRRRHAERFPDLGHFAQIPGRHAADFRRRRHHEPIRSHGSRVAPWNTTTKKPVPNGLRGFAMPSQNSSGSIRNRKACGNTGNRSR